MNRLEHGEGHWSTSRDQDGPPIPPVSDMMNRVRTWRVTFYAFTAALVLSFALSGSGEVAARTLAYLGAGGMIMSVVGAAIVVTQGRGTRTGVSGGTSAPHRIGS